MKISIITINFNNLDGLKKTVESVINQTYQNIEYLIIDGGSTDGSAEYIQELSSHFDYWVSEPDKGIYNAMNKGIDKATGEYLLFLNSGDYLADSKVIRKFTDFEDKGDITYGDIYFDYGDSKKLWNQPEKLELKHLYFGAIGHPGIFFNSELFNQFGNYEEKYKIAADWVYYFKLFLTTEVVFKKIDLVVSFFVMDGISSSNAGLVQGEIERKDFLLNQFGSRLNNSILELLEKDSNFDKLSEKYNLIMSNKLIKTAKWLKNMLTSFLTAKLRLKS